MFLILKVDAPWSVVATPLNNTAIKLTWLRPKVSRSDQMVSKHRLHNCLMMVQQFTRAYLLVLFLTKIAILETN